MGDIIKRFLKVRLNLVDSFDFVGYPDDIIGNVTEIGQSATFAAIILLSRNDLIGDGVLARTSVAGMIASVTVCRHCPVLL